MINTQLATFALAVYGFHRWGIPSSDNWSAICSTSYELIFATIWHCFGVSVNIAVHIKVLTYLVTWQLISLISDTQPRSLSETCTPVSLIKYIICCTISYSARTDGPVLTLWSFKDAYEQWNVVLWAACQVTTDWEDLASNGHINHFTVCHTRCQELHRLHSVHHN